MQSLNSFIHHSGWTVQYSNAYGWYIYKNRKYLRNNNTISANCGKNGFWKKKEDAISFLELWYLKKHPFVSKEEMEI
jgi:hypothetical protein